jgi:hypothetical protein
VLPLVHKNRFLVSISLFLTLGSVQFISRDVKASGVSVPLLAGWTKVDSNQLPPGLQWAVLSPLRGLTRSCVNCAQESTSLSPDSYAIALKNFHEREPLARWLPLGYVQANSIRWTCGLLATQEDVQPWTAQASTVIEGCGIVVTLVCSDGDSEDHLQLLADVLKHIVPDPRSPTSP